MLTSRLSAPDYPRATALGNDSISLSWSISFIADVYGISGYKVYRSASADGPYTLREVVYSGVAYTDSGLSAGTYYYKVSAISLGGHEGEQSDYVSATVGDSISAPTGLGATPSGNDNISLSWSSVSDAASYKIYRSGGANGDYNQIGTAYSTSYTDPSLSAGTYYYKVRAVDSSGNEGPQSDYASATVSSSTGGDTLPGAKGKLTLTGFNEFNGKYVYSALVTASGKSLIGTNAVEFTSADYAISMVQISGGTAEVPLYTATGAGTTVADIYVPYEDSETIQTVAIMIVTDSDGKFTSSDAEGIAANYAAMIGSNSSNTSFTPATSNGSITISRSDAKTMTEITEAITGGDYTIMQTVKYILMENTQ
jgi:hypothetical protein